MIDMIRQAQKIRIYPTDEQKRQLAGAMGCCKLVVQLRSKQKY